MIISRTPLRMSFIGGGSDLKDYYKTGHGSVLSTTINKYIYVIAHPQFTENIRVSYSQTEFVNGVNNVQHNLIRECLKTVGGIEKGIDIAYVSDLLPDHQGSGLGGSSSITVGTLNALYAYQNQHTPSKDLAEKACEIEIEKLGHPIGKQDQYAVAYGGFNHIRFNFDESVFVNPILLKKETKKNLEENLILFYTGINTISSTILAEQRENTKRNPLTKNSLDTMVGLSEELLEELKQDNLSNFGEILHKNWMLKKTLASKVTNPKIEEYYKNARDAGAIGGKILGSGGGGFLLVYCERKNQEGVKEILSNLKEIDFKFEYEGSKIIYVDN